jgi:acrylyl-CoA reductase (NADPH)
VNDQPFTAFRIHQEHGKVVARLERIALDELSPGEVVVKVQYSTINYKDALAATGKGKILRKYPLVAGIDLAGEIVSATSSTWAPGTRVVVTGCGLSETHDGGYAQYARVRDEWIVPIPDALSVRDCMAIGTAGFTAALAIHRMEENGQSPASGEVVVTGATGGVGSLAIDMLAHRGYGVVAVTGKRESKNYLTSLGATRVLTRDEIDLGSRPLEQASYAGAIDSVGGELLAWLMRTMDFRGNIASVGMAASATLTTTVLPLILRGVNLLGINSVYTPRDLRLRIWQRLASDLRPRNLDKIVTRTIGLSQLSSAFDQYIQGSVVGRTLVQIADPQDADPQD